MEPYRFRLRKVLEWRRTQLDIEEASLRRLHGELERRKLSLLKIERARQQAERQVLAGERIAGADLRALDFYRTHLRELAVAAAARISAADQAVCSQRQRVADARRGVRLLEKLDERRHAEWQYAFDKEIEEAAGESYLSRWHPETGPRGA